MPRKVERREKVVVFRGGKVVNDGRVLTIVFDEKPDGTVIERLRANGFHWQNWAHGWRRESSVAARVAAVRALGLAAPNPNKGAPANDGTHATDIGRG
jgi:hypothetical protein